MTRVCSWIVTPRRSTAAASPRTSRAGWIAAQSGVYDRAATPRCRGGRLAPRRRRAAAGRPRHGPTPRASSTSCLARVSCALPRASRIVPPLATCASMPSAAATRATSSTLARIAACWASGGLAAAQRRERRELGREQRRAPAAVAARTRRSRRPPTRGRRSTATGPPRPGSTPSRGPCSRRRRSPRRPRGRPASAGRGVQSSPALSCQNERPAYVAAQRTPHEYVCLRSLR